MDITFMLRGEPKGKAAAAPFVMGKRVTVDGQQAVLGAHARAHKDPKTRRYEDDIAAVVAELLPPSRSKLPLAVDILAVMPRPQRLRRKRDPQGMVYAVRKPDIDNVRKAVQDAVRKHWRDDTVVVFGRTIRVYAEKHGAPRLVVRIHEDLPDLSRPPPWLRVLMEHDPLAGQWLDLPEGG